MANRIANLLSNTKTRTLVLLVVGVLSVGVAIAVSQSKSKTSKPGPESASTAAKVPNQIRSTPGEEVSQKYRELQEKANQIGSQTAAKSGDTFIPTVVGNAKSYGDQDFDKQLSTAFDDMGGKCSKESVAALRKQGMDTNHIIMQLKAYGCSAAAIASLFSPDEIAAALLANDCTLTGEGGAGAAAGSLTGCNTDSAKKMQALGYDTNKIAATFKTNGCKLDDTVKALKELNIDPAAIATALKATGASAGDIATAMKNAGYDATTVASALTKAGFSKLDILPALSKAGFNSVDIAKAMANLDQNDNAALLAQQRNSDADAQRLAAQQEAQQLTQYSQQRAQKITELENAMEQQKTQIMQVWTEIPQQVMVQGDWAQNAKNTTGGSTSKSAAAAAAAAAAQAAPKTILKAGSILFAVLDTAVNSDQNGPILATIVSGQLKGAKLMGKMTTNLDAESITLSFTSINIPSEKKSMGISAVAIDPDTARTSLASDVDHHYLMRWGSLFASSFVQGYASAVASSGTTSTTSQGAAGTVTNTTTPALNAKQQLFQGISAVGTKWSEVVGRNFDRPITITIDQGTGLGILLTSDLVYGTAPEFYTLPKAGTIPSSIPAANAGQLGAPATSLGTLAAPGTATTVNTGLTTDQTAALISTILKQQPGQVQGATNSTGGIP